VGRLHLLILLCFCACSGSRIALYVDHQQGIDGAWTAAGNKGAAHMDATGDTVTVRFLDRTFVIPGLRSCRGMVAEDEVHLTGHGMSIDLLPDQARFQGPSGVVERRMADLPTDREIVYTQGALLFR